MSGKKASPSAWYDCAKCGQKLLRLYATKHNDLNCGTIFPIFESGTLITTLSKVPKASRITKLPFIDSPMGSSTIFLSDVVIRECKFETFNWVSVAKVENRSDSDVLNNEFTPVAMKVWPIPDQPGNLHAIVTAEGFSVNSGVTVNDRYSLQKLSSESIQAAETIEVHTSTAIDLDNDRLCRNLKRQFKHRLLTRGNKFLIRYYSELLEIKIHCILGADQNNSSEEKLCKKLDDLSCGDLRASEYSKVAYFEVTNDTNFSVQNKYKQNSEFPRKIQDYLPTIEDVGGLDDSVKEFISTIQYKFTTPSIVPNGIILHGQHGTGKTLLLRAVCNSLKLNTVVFREISLSKELKNQHFTSEMFASTLDEAFSKAVSSQPAAIIIENIESFSSSNPNSRTGYTIPNFSAALRSLMSFVKQSKVMVFASSSNIDSVDISLRSPHIFGKEIEIPVPSAIQREDICTKILQRMCHSLSCNDIKLVASITHGFVGADLQGLFMQASVSLCQEYFDSHHTTLSSLSDAEISRPFFISHVQEAIKYVRPSAMKSILIDVPNVRWDDIGGQGELKLKLKQAIEWPLKHPAAFQRLGITPPKGILMYGPPGCSKTMIAKALATESGLNFISVKGSELFSKWVGESEKAVQKIFRKARQVAPCIVFFDEIDSLGGERGTSSGASNVHERVLAQLLIEIDGVEPLKDVTIVAATNRPDIIDQALLRPGRLDRIIYVPLPDVDAREEILKIWFRKMPVDKTIDIKQIVQLTEGYSGAELTAVCHEAALHALDENIEASVIQNSHFTSALRTVRPRISKEQLLFYDNYHESCKIK